MAERVSRTGAGGLPRAVTILLGLAAGVVTVLGARELAWLIGPVFLALTIVLLVHPLHTWLRRRQVPEAVAMLALIVAIYAVIVVLVMIIVLSLGRLVTVLPAYLDEADGLVAQLRAWLVAQGVGRDQAAAVVASLDPSAALRALTPLLTGIAGFAANVIFLLSLLLFLGIDATGASARLTLLSKVRPQLARAFGYFATNTRRFLGVTTIFAVITGFADTLLLLWLDIPLAVLWGLLAAICNYIPYVGFVIGVIPPALLSLLIGGWRLMVIVVVAYIVLNSLFTSIIQPYFVGDAVGVSMPVTLVALIFWGWVLGPLGAILAIPLTLLVKAVLVDTDPRAAWAAALFGSTRSMRREVDADVPYLSEIVRRQDQREAQAAGVEPEDPAPTTPASAPPAATDVTAPPEAETRRADEPTGPPRAT